MNAPQDPKRPDTLADLYREASAQDAGPSDASTARILAHARAKAAQNPAAALGDLDSAGQQGQHFGGEAANDRRWWLQALGSLAAIGLVSWLALQQLHEPGAPQLEAPQMDSAPSAASAPPPPPGAPTAPAAADSAAAPGSAKMRSEAAPMGKAASPAAGAAPAPAPAAAVSAGAGSANTSPAPARAPALQAERRTLPAPASTPAPVAPPLPAPVAPASPAAAAVAPAYPAAPPAARKQAAEASRVAEQPAPTNAAAAAASEASAPLVAAPTLPLCGPDLDAKALAEQRRRIQVYDRALAAGLPGPVPAPLCRPAPAHEAAPGQPVDSR